jgi:hypothetical protein
VAKKSKVKSRALGSAAAPPRILPPNFPLQSFAFDPTGRLEQRHIKGVKEGASEYTLDDGTVLIVKPAVIDVKRASGQWNEQGEPIYVVQAATVVTAKHVPKNLMRKRR